MLNEQSTVIKNAYLRYIRENKQDGMNKKDADKEAKAISDNILDWDEEANKMFLAMLPTYLQASERSNALANTLFLTQDNKVLFNIIREDVLQWINTEGAKKITQVTDTTKNIVRREISKGLQEGLSVNKISNNLTDKIKELSKGRAVTIAQTEIHNTFTYTREQNMKSAGFKRWRWITARDEKVRTSHVRVNNEIRKIGEKFSNGLVRPGDPNGPIEEIANCRCEVIPVD